MRRQFRAFAIGSVTCAALALLGGCMVKNAPINTLTMAAQPASPDYITDVGDDGSTIIGLAFSGGGMRASAFSYGILRALDELVIDERPYRRSMVNNVRMVAGVSGGAVTASYFGLKGPKGFHDFEQRFLLQNPESKLRKSFSPINLSRVLSGGMNDDSSFAHWLDVNLFEGATFQSLRNNNTPMLWINASDIYNRTPFLFNEDTFAALCSDLNSLKVADAVATSAAFPVVFAPMVLESTKNDCPYSQPHWMPQALDDPNTSLRLHAYANALDAYRRNESLNYVKLLDGGLTDNLGITGLVLARAAAQTPHGPLSAVDAVKVRHLLFLVADAGRGQTGSWGDVSHGPGIAPLLQAAIDTNMAASLREGMDALRFAMNDWKVDLIRYRCALPLSTVQRIRGTLKGWNCHDVDVVVEHLAFTDLDAETEKRLNTIPTRLHLPREDIELLVSAGRQTVLNHSSIMKTAATSGRNAGVSTYSN